MKMTPADVRAPVHDHKERTMTIKSKIRTIPDYPKKGIMFRDITTLIKDPVGFRLVIDTLTQRYIHADFTFDTIVGIESRGFIIGSALAYTLGKGFIPIRKKGKLPAEVVTQEYSLEYGTDRIEIHKDALKERERVLLVDDLLATGGTALAAAALVEKLGGVIVEMCFIVDLPDVGGKKKLLDKGYNVFALTEFEGE
jgi:adenine phosphoribosyltransferase